MMTKQGEKMINDFIFSPTKQQINKEHIEKIKGGISCKIEIEDIGRRILCYIETFEPETELQENNINALICSYVAKLSNDRKEKISYLNRNFYSPDMMYFIYKRNKGISSELCKISNFLHERKQIEESDTYIFKVSEQYVNENLCNRDFLDAFLMSCLNIYDNPQIKSIITKINENLLLLDKINEDKNSTFEELGNVLDEGADLEEQFEILLRRESEKFEKLNSCIN